MACVFGTTHYPARKYYVLDDGLLFTIAKLEGGVMEERSTLN